MTLPLPELPGVEHEWIRVGDVDLHVAIAGEGPPIVLLHGWPQHWWSWRRVIPELATTNRVICPDLRGHGWSSAPRGDYAKTTLADDVIGLLDALEIEKTALAGHDWGGWVGVLVGAKAPERITHLLVMSIPPPGFKPRRGPQTLLFGSYQVLLSTPVLGQATLRAVPGFVERMIRLGSERQEAFTDEDLRVYSHVFKDPDRAAATVALYRTFLLREMHQQPAYVMPPIPHRVLIGEKDGVLATVDLRPGEAEVIGGIGHFLPEEDPDTVVRAIRELLAE